LTTGTERRARAWILVAGYAALIFGISSIPAANLSRTVFKVSDKLAHLTEYAGFGLLLTMALRSTLDRVPRWALLVVAVLVGAGVGALDETYQATVPGRARELLDWVADVTGSFAGAGLALGLRAWVARRRSTAGAAEGQDPTRAGN
jgi:VanZ family protein